MHVYMHVHTCLGAHTCIHCTHSRNDAHYDIKSTCVCLTILDIQCTLIVFMLPHENPMTRGLCFNPRFVDRSVKSKDVRSFSLRYMAGRWQS